MQTTNELLEETIKNIRILIQLAKADLENAIENNYQAAKKNAENRIKVLNKAKNDLNDNCYK